MGEDEVVDAPVTQQVLTDVVRSILVHSRKATTYSIQVIVFSAPLWVIPFIIPISYYGP